MTYIVKFKGYDGDWFYHDTGKWSDSYHDARHFRSRKIAEDAAEAAQARLNANGHAGQRQAVCRVIAFGRKAHA